MRYILYFSVALFLVGQTIFFLNRLIPCFLFLIHPLYVFQLLCHYRVGGWPFWGPSSQTFELEVTGYLKQSFSECLQGSISSGITCRVNGWIVSLKCSRRNRKVICGNFKVFLPWSAGRLGQNLSSFHIPSHHQLVLSSRNWASKFPIVNGVGGHCLPSLGCPWSASTRSRFTHTFTKESKHWHVSFQSS